MAGAAGRGRHLGEVATYMLSNQGPIQIVIPKSSLTLRQETLMQTDPRGAWEPEPWQRPRQMCGRSKIAQ